MTFHRSSLVPVSGETCCRLKSPIKEESIVTAMALFLIEVIRG
jgi:hypothetical protein